MVLQDISLNLINVADQILKSADETKTTSDKPLQFVKNGRKYKLVNNDKFEIIKESNKYLIVATDFNNFHKQCSLISSYYILSNIDNVIENYPELCLSIMGAARELELNKWYDLDTCVTTVQGSSYEIPEHITSQALKIASRITKQHINIGLLILCSSKINFFHTDHMASKRIEGKCLKDIVINYFGTEAIVSDECYNAIRCFSHWGSTKGILYKLNLRGLWVDDDLVRKFSSFPTVPVFLRDSIYERYPLGTSKYSLCKKAVTMIAESWIGPLVPLDCEVLEPVMVLCRDIEQDPCLYHLRLIPKKLSRAPKELSELPDTMPLLVVCSAIVHGANGLVAKQLTMAPRFPKRSVVKDHELFKLTRELLLQLSNWQKTGGDELGFIRKMNNSSSNFKDVVYKTFTKYQLN